MRTGTLVLVGVTFVATSLTSSVPNQSRAKGGAAAKAQQPRRVVVSTDAMRPSFVVPSPDGTLIGTAPAITGMPFAPSVMRDPQGWRVETESGVPVAAQLVPAAYWSDGSIRVVHVALVADVRPGGGERYRLVQGKAGAIDRPLALGDDGARLTVNTGASTFTFDKRSFVVDGRDFRLVVRGVQYVAAPFSAPASQGPLGQVAPWQVEVSGPMMAVVKVEGDFRKADGTSFDPLIRFRARMTFWRGSSKVRVEFTFRQNHSQNWNPGPYPAPLQVDEVRAGDLQLLPRGPHAFGAGLEKTFDLDVERGTISHVVIDWDPAQPFPRPAPRPVGFPDPAYVESTGAYGLMVTPISGIAGERGEALERFERLHRAQVMPSEVDPQRCLPSGTIVEHMARFRGNWRDYGDLHWGSDCGADEPFSRNHYDWIAALYMHALRTGYVEFFDAAQIMARHEIDLDIYHTWENGPWFNFQKNWEMGNHMGPANCFGGGRPTHTWNRGYLMHYLWAGERRGLDAVIETVEGARGFLYEAAGVPLKEREIRGAGWLSMVLGSRYILDPTTPLNTPKGPVSPAQAVADALEGIIRLEEHDGSRGYVFFDENAKQVQPLQSLYALEAMTDAYEFVLRGSGHPIEARLRATMERMVRFITTTATFGGATRDGGYVPMQITYRWVPGQTKPDDGQAAWMLFASDAAGWLWLRTGDADALDYARRAFRDFVFYRESGGDKPLDPKSRTPIAYGSCFYVGTESKIHGWSTRFGQWFLAAEREGIRQRK